MPSTSGPVYHVAWWKAPRVVIDSEGEAIKALTGRVVAAAVSECQATGTLGTPAGPELSEIFNMATSPKGVNACKLSCISVKEP